MDSAIHSETGQELLAPMIWKRFDNKTIHKKGMWLCPKEEIENNNEIKEDIYVTPVKAHERKNGYIASFFRLYPNQSDKIILRKESEEHKKAKAVVCTLLTEEFNFKLKYDKDIYFVKDIPIDYKKLQSNIRKREVTKHNIITGQKKRADVCIPFIFNPYFGNGIAIEIKISEKDEKVEEKEDFWFQRGYSVIWMDESDFIKIDGKWGLKYNTLQIIPFSIGYNKIMNERETNIQSYLQSCYEVYDEIKKCITIGKEKIHDEYEKHQFQLTNDIKHEKQLCNELLTEFRIASKNTCRTCKYGSKSKDNSGLIACWINTKWKHGHNKRPSNHEPLDGCDAHEHR